MGRPDKERTRAIARKIGAAAGGHLIEDAVAALIVSLTWFAIYQTATLAEARELAADWAETLAESIDENYAIMKRRRLPRPRGN